MTKTFTVTDMIYLHRSTAAAAGTSAAPANFAAGASSIAISSAAPANLAATAMASNEPTTTLTRTSTTTSTITLELASTNGANNAAATNVAAGMGGACSVVTVTTVLQSTIYVTATPSTAAAPAMTSQAATSVKAAVANLSSSISAILAQASSLMSPSSSMPSPLPASFFPQGNSTEAANSTKHRISGTGFITLSSGSAMPTGYKI